MSRTHTGKASDLRFDRVSKAVAAQNPLLLEMLADTIDVLVAQLSADKGSVGIRARPWLCGKREIARMGCQQRVLASECVSAMAGPSKRLRHRGHAGPDRVEFDVAITAEHMRIALDQRRLVAPFPERSGTSVATIELGDVASTQPLHHLRDAAGVLGRRQKMSVIVHQHIGMETAGGCRQCIREQRQIPVSVLIVQETW